MGEVYINISRKHGLESDESAATSVFTFIINEKKFSNFCAYRKYKPWLCPFLDSILNSSES